VNDIETIELIKGTSTATFTLPGLGETTIPTIELKPMVEAWEHQAEPTATEFLNKAKAICESKQTCHKCPIDGLCHGMSEIEDEAEIISKVMDYRLEDKDAERN
jgi:hypothetical protein